MMIFIIRLFNIKNYSDIKNIHTTTYNHRSLNNICQENH